MEIQTAIQQHVRQRLEDAFGKAMAMMIWASAMNKAGLSSSLDPDRDGYLRLIDAICSDDRCVDMWGAAGCRSTADAWRTLV